MQPQNGRPPRRERFVTTVPIPHLGQTPNCSDGAVASFLIVIVSLPEVPTTVWLATPAVASAVLLNVPAAS